MTSWTINPIGIIEGPFSEKFGVPRQSLLAPEVNGLIRLLAPFDHLDALEGLEGFSHLWLQFGFHLNQGHEPSHKIRPPRLGGNLKVGVFASRSSFRPNSLGLSVVLNKGIKVQGKNIWIEIAGHDLVNGTPIFDIKPYLPRYDSHPTASEGWVASNEFPTFEISWGEEALNELQKIYPDDFQLKKRQIEKLLSLHPMPTYKVVDSNHQFGMSFESINIKWKIFETTLNITALTPHI